MTQMGLNYLNYVETNRSNLANEGLKSQQNSETRRHNVAGEGVALSQLDINRGSLDESIRSNKAREAENNRSNLARESENYRTDVANEGIKQGNLNESVRAHQLEERETARHNITAENNERYKTNLANSSQYLAELKAGQALGEEEPAIVGSHALGTLESLLGNMRISSNSKNLF